MEVKRLSLKYRIDGQVRGLIAHYGLDKANAGY
jgi:hypothetical protein